MATIPNNDLSATSEGTFFFLIKSDKSLLEIGQKSELDFVSVKYLKKENGQLGTKYYKIHRT